MLIHQSDTHITIIQHIKNIDGILLSEGIYYNKLIKLNLYLFHILFSSCHQRALYFIYLSFIIQVCISIMYWIKNLLQYKYVYKSVMQTSHSIWNNYCLPLTFLIFIFVSFDICVCVRTWRLCFFMCQYGDVAIFTYNYYVDVKFRNYK